jgi:hypothetical protein
MLCFVCLYRYASLQLPNQISTDGAWIRLNKQKANIQPIIAENLLHLLKQAAFSSVAVSNYIGLNPDIFYILKYISYEN